MWHKGKSYWMSGLGYTVSILHSVGSIHCPFSFFSWNVLFKITSLKSNKLTNNMPSKNYKIITKIIISKIIIDN